MASAEGPPAAALLQLITGYWETQAIYVAAKLGLADLMADGPVRVEVLAASTHTDAPTLQRLLRALAGDGVFREAVPGAFGLTPLGERLRSGVPGSMRSLAIMHGEEQYRAWGELLHSVQTAFDHRFGMPYFAYLAQHPDADRVFNAAMSDWTNQLADAVAETYDFSPVRTVVDVGGSYGTLLVAILRRYPALRGVLFDQPHVVVAAEAQLTAAGMVERCRVVGGDFFVALPAGGDAYVLAQILHDWDDARCLSILRQCRRVLPEAGRVLVVELVLPAGDEPSFTKWMDLHMLVLPGGRERTATEYDALFQAVGSRLGQVVPTAAGPSIVEAIPI